MNLNLPSIGIDLGTTFSCVSYLNDEGTPTVITNAEGERTTPSVVWFDGGASAFVGKKANDRKPLGPTHIFEFVKRYIGREDAPPFFIGGFSYSPIGISAIILKKLRLDAALFFKKQGLIPNDIPLQKVEIKAVITVPAYFGDRQRQDTKLAGLASGLDVIGIINEPTAAALTYGHTLNIAKTVFVFDLGGGTFDVTLVRLEDGKARVLAFDGLDELGGRDWDDLIQDYIFEEYRRQSGLDIPLDAQFDVQKLALETKFALTDNESHSGNLAVGYEQVSFQFHRKKQNRPSSFDDDPLEEETFSSNVFYFEDRSLDKITLLKTFVSRVMQKADLTWHDVDEVVLAGGASRMPMISKLLSDVSKRNIGTAPSGFDMDTAISQGAALYASMQEKVTDVLSRSVGVEVMQSGRKMVEVLLPKNTKLPSEDFRSYNAQENAVLKIYEGESHDPLECILRGRLELKNLAGEAKVTLKASYDGTIEAFAETNGIVQELKIQVSGSEINIETLKSKIDGIQIR